MPPDVTSTNAATWPLIAKYAALDAALARRVEGHAFLSALYEFVRFGVKQAWACVFGGLMVALLVATFAFYPKDAPVPRYDALVVAAVVLQLVLILTKLETLEEASVIFLFHAVGTVMEIFKTATGSWAYPEASYLRLGGVPLFTGFMYASIGSYIARSWRLFDFRFAGYPPFWQTLCLSAATYLNFFSDHFGIDVRNALFLATGLLYGRTWIFYRIHTRYRRMPIIASTFLVTMFIWLAENIGTATRAWIYPSQAQAWHVVPPAKFGSWYLLVILSAVLVTLVHPPTSVPRQSA